MQRKKNMSKRGVQATFIFNIVKSISKKDIVVFWHVHVMSPPKPRLIKMSIGQWSFSEFTLPLLLKPKWRAKISFVAHAMLLRYCRIARLLLFAHGILLQRLRMVSPHCNQMKTISQRSRNVLCCLGYYLTYKYGM